MKTVRLAVKRIADIVLSSLVLILLSPVLILIALAVRLSSPGPVLFKQQRAGLKGRPFGIFKFRTMIHNAPDLRNPDGSTYTGEDDPRVTKVGRFLRKTSLDEFPQFFNVLGGSMSIVGPRPDKIDQIELYEGDEIHKLDMKPGITGYAMIHGRNSVPWKRRLALDAYYAQHHTLTLDLIIALKTVPLLLRREGIETPAAPVASVKAEDNRAEPLLK
jgi:lipopolysaccharide/colanic/teichoic acid biosynthesis glycosyltransferase